MVSTHKSGAWKFLKRKFTLQDAKRLDCALASLAPGCSVLTSWICFSRSSENNHNSAGFTSLRKEMCISSPDPFNGKVFGIVLITYQWKTRFLSPSKVWFWWGSMGLSCAVAGSLVPVIGTLEGLGSQGVLNSFPCYRPWFSLICLSGPADQGHVPVHVLSWFWSKEEIVRKWERCPTPNESSYVSVQPPSGSYSFGQHCTCYIKPFFHVWQQKAKWTWQVLSV